MTGQPGRSTAIVLVVIVLLGALAIAVQPRLAPNAPTHPTPTPTEGK